MQLLHRPAHAPLGTAFFLFVSLAIVPVSLRAAGVQVSFSPRLSAAVDAWKQIAEVFGSSSQPGSESDLAALTTSDGEPFSASGESACSRRESACITAAEESVSALPQLPETTSKDTYKRASCTRTVVRPSRASKQEIELPRVAFVDFAASVEKSARALEAQGDVTLEKATREEMLKSLGTLVVRQRFDTRMQVKNRYWPKSFRVLFQSKATAPTAARAAECKVRAVLSCAKWLQPERASLVSVPTAPDNTCEF